MIGDSERSGQYEEALRVMLRGWQAGIWTAMQGAIVSFDPDKQTASVQIGTQIQVTEPDGAKTWVDMPLLVDCPVQFPRGGNVVFTFPVTAGDECLVVFANRCIDPWYQQGGIQPQSEFRMHDLSDGFVFVGFSSMPHVVSGFNATAAEIRSLDNATKIALDPAAQTIKLQATTATTAVFSPSGIALNSPTLTHNGVNIGATHVHGGVQSGASNTLVPH